MKRRTKAQILEDARKANAERIAQFADEQMMITQFDDEPAIVEPLPFTSGISLPEIRGSIDLLTDGKDAGATVVNVLDRIVTPTLAATVTLNSLDLTLNRLDRFNTAIETINRTQDHRPEYIDTDAGIAVYCVDSLETMRELRNMLAVTQVSDAVRLFDVTITDPPYSEYTHKNARRGNINTKQLGGSFQSFDRLTIRKAFRHILALTRRWTVSNVDIAHVQTLVDYFNAENPFGRYIRTGAWVKENGAPQMSGDRPAQGWEAVAILHRQGALRWNGHGKPAVWHTKVVRGKQHPAQKPSELISAFVSLFSDPGDLIFDPFCGAGTTLVAAKALGRSAIGFEIDSMYVQQTITRLRDGLL